MSRAKPTSSCLALNTFRRRENAPKIYNCRLEMGYSATLSSQSCELRFASTDSPVDDGPMDDSPVAGVCRVFFWYVATPAVYAV